MVPERYGVSSISSGFLQPVGSTPARRKARRMEPMQNFFAYEGLAWNGGKMDLEASNENGDKLSVNAEFKGPYNLRITYKGKVQIWNVNTEQVTEIF